MAPLVTKRLINTEEYYKMGETGMLKPDENVELIKGEIYTMAPIGSKHAEIVRCLNALLYDTEFDKVIISSQNPVHIDDWNEIQPDIALLKHKEKGYANAHPVPSEVLIVIEVSVTTYNIDLNVKLPLYASTGIPEYWIINLNENCIEVYEQPVDDQYRKRMLYNPGDQIILMDKPFDVAEILLV